MLVIFTKTILKPCTKSLDMVGVLGFVRYLAIDGFILDFGLLGE